MELIEDAHTEIAASVSVGSNGSRAISLDNKDGSILPGMCTFYVWKLKESRST
jgi:hypothetical protein